MIVVFEGRDAAGKGGTIKAITERVSPRVFRVVALPAPSDREKSQLYMQRYLQHVPAAGEIVIFDRSWYNRAGVEYVMGFCSKAQHRRFLEVCPEFEQYIVDDGILLIKFWLEVSDEEQKRRFEARIADPLRQWKLSPTDLCSRSRWFEYSRARDMMLEATDTKFAPWYIVPSDDKRRARLNCISHLLSLIPYKKLPREEGEASQALDARTRTTIGPRSRAGGSSRRGTRPAAESNPMEAADGRSAPRLRDDATAWHAMAADEVVTRLATDVRKGLDAGEASSRLAKYGPNRLPEGKKRGPLARFLSQFNNILVYVLLGAGFTKLMLGLWIDAAIILGVVDPQRPARLHPGGPGREGPRLDPQHAVRRGPRPCAAARRA